MCYFSFFWSPMLSYFPVFFVVTGRYVDKGRIGNYTKKIFSHFPFSLVQLNAWHEVILIWYPKINFRHYFTIYIIFNDKIATDAYIYAISAPWCHSLWKSFNCRYDPRMDYAFCLLTLKSSKKWWSPLFSATCNFNHQILPFGILFLTFINTNVFYLLSFKFAC